MFYYSFANFKIYIKLTYKLKTFTKLIFIKYSQSFKNYKRKIK